LDFAAEICTAVCNIWRPNHGQSVIINLPSTVEVHTPNVFADRIEWFCDNFIYRPHVRISVHPHNDRGCAVASGELAVLAGADRVEGTLLGNGERTGNMDIITMAMNLYSQGIDPQLDLSDMANIVKCAEECTDIATHVRHPYVGELVYTAFSGSHQDAIRKGLHAWQKIPIEQRVSAWNVPYLPIDPQDIGRSYAAVVRVNSQSGKGGIAFSLERDHGLQLPRALQIEFSQHVQNYSEKIGGEVSGDAIQQLFQHRYVNCGTPWQLQNYQVQTHAERVSVQAELRNDNDNSTRIINGEGSGALAALVDAIAVIVGPHAEIVDYHEHALRQGTASKAICYLQLAVSERRYWGVGIADDTVRAAFVALLSAININNEPARNR
jgi:2-isopropylmalate synthase